MLPIDVVNMVNVIYKHKHQKQTQQKKTLKPSRTKTALR